MIYSHLSIETTRSSVLKEVAVMGDMAVWGRNFCCDDKLLLVKDGYDVSRFECGMYWNNVKVPYLDATGEPVNKEKDMAKGDVVK